MSVCKQLWEEKKIKKKINRLTISLDQYWIFSCSACDA